MENSYQDLTKNSTEEMEDLKEIQSHIHVSSYTSPFCVSCTKKPADETMEQIGRVRERFLTLPEKIQEKLMSYQASEKIQEIGKRYDLELLQMADIARAIRSYYFGEIKLEDFPAVLAREMGINPGQAREISQIIIQRIIQDDSYEKSYQSQLVEISFSDALKKYPALGEQLITSSHIKLESFPDPVRPSVKNWISDYTSHLGYGVHGSMERGQYLFREENTRNLSTSDRQKLAFVLKAFDENSAVTVNTNTKQVVFPTVPYNTVSSPGSQRAVNNIMSPPARFASPKIDKIGEARRAEKNIPGANLQFSSPQKLPYEKVYQDQPFKITGPEKDDEETEEDLPKNVINLKK